VVTVTTPPALVAWRAGRIGWRNLQGFQRTLHVEPLEVDEVLADLSAPGRALPNQPWPPASGVTVPRVAAAYRDYAHKRRETAVLVGELVLITAGAALGASLPIAVEGGWRIWPVCLCVVAAAFGVLVKRNGEQRWNEVAARYERRRAELLAPRPRPRRKRTPTRPAARQ
jgi:hypothetical protein